MQPIAAILDQLRTGHTTSTALTEHCLANIANPQGEGPRTYTRVYAEQARKAAAEADQLLAANSATDKPLLGLPISVKDLFDIAGEPTTAGSLILRNAAPAMHDAPIVQRLRQAGAVILGKTNMTEFAYSGLGLNPHYGTPANPYDRATRRIPGGSSSGAAISVTDRMAAAAIGTDTGGSTRIPAALCGLTGFKPTARRIPLDGAIPLAPSLDSIGPIAPTVDCCARIDAILAAEPRQPLTPQPLNQLNLAILQGYVLDDLEPEVATNYDRSLKILHDAGARLTPIHFEALNDIPRSNQTAAVEAYAWHRNLLTQHPTQYDPHVSHRILLGHDVLAADYLDLLAARRRIIAAATQTFTGFDAILLPTVPRIAPPIAELEASEDAYFQANGAMLRNTSIFNFLDGCALSIPNHPQGDAPTGLMIAGLPMQDHQILSTGAAIEAALTR